MIDSKEVVTIDFESYSECDIGKHGSYVYSLHESTEVLMISVKFGHEDTLILDIYGGDTLPQRLIDHIKAGKTIIAHGVAFEWSIWKNVCVVKYNWPVINDDQWFDTMVQCGANTIPLSLDNSTAVLELSNTKNDIGKKLIKLFSMPQPKTFIRVLPEHQPAQYKLFLQYCLEDTSATFEMFCTLLQPKEHELKVNIPLTFKLNTVGLPIDVESVNKIYPKILIEKESYTERISALTNGTITTVNQTARMIKWLSANHNIEMDNFQAGTVEEFLKRDDLPPEAKQLLEMRSLGGKSSTGKYERLAHMTSPEGNAHSLWVHHGTNTGRLTARGIQPSNLPKPSLDYMDPLIVKNYLLELSESELENKYHIEYTVSEIIEDLTALSIEENKELKKKHYKLLEMAGMDALIYNLCEKDNAEINAIYGSFMKAASTAIRMLVKPPEGNILFGADYAAIEARVVFWLAGCKRGIQTYLDGRDNYKDLASVIYKVDYGDVNDTQRWLGKQGILAAAYGIGWKGFLNACENYGVSVPEETAKLVVETYRDTYYEVPELWIGIEKAAMLAMTTGRECFAANGRLSFKLLRLKNNQLFLYMKLPSGRLMAYPQARLEIVTTPWGAKKKAITYRKWIDNGWRKESTYGGKLVENAVQAISRDIMYAGMDNVSKAGFTIIMQVYDEAISYAPEGFMNLEDYENLLCEPMPDWCRGIPLAAEGKILTRYSKL